MFFVTGEGGYTSHLGITQFELIRSLTLAFPFRHCKIKTKVLNEITKFILIITKFILIITIFIEAIKKAVKLDAPSPSFSINMSVTAGIVITGQI